MGTLLTNPPSNIDWDFDTEFFSGAAFSGTTLVPAIEQVAIDGHPYVIDPQKYQRVTVPLRRESTDESVEPGEQTLNTGGAWRRSQDNWFMGANQLYLDNRFAFVSVYTNSGQDPSVRTRFWRSKGLNTWNEGALTLLPEQALKGTSSSATQFLEAIGSTLFWWDGTNVKSSINPTAATPTWTTITPPLSLGSWPTVFGFTTDGSNLYIALGTYGIAMVAAGSSTATIMRPTPSTPVITNGGTPGTTTYDYFVVATDANGFKSLVSAQGQTTTGNASLSPTNFNLITWTTVPGAVSYDVLKTDTAHTIGTTTQTSFTDDGSHSSTAYSPPTNTTEWLDDTQFVGYGNGFLLASQGPLLVQVGSNGMTTLVMKHFNSSFVWTASCGSPNAIYVAGQANNVSELYGIQLSTTTFGLGAPYIAGAVSDGEVINALVYYQGIVSLSTSIGVRTASDSNSNGHLTMGPVINNLASGQVGNSVTSPSLCNMVYGNLVYFGVSNFQENDGIYGGNASCSGLGSLFLSEFSAALLPAHTSDVMASNGVTGNTVACTIYEGTPFFAVAGSGVWGPSGNVVSYGYLEAGWVRYGTVEDKILVSADLRHDPLPAGSSVVMDVVPFSEPSFTALVSSETGGIGPDGPVSTGNQVGEAFHVILQLNRATNTAVGPTLHRWTSRAVIIAARQDQIIVPIIWADLAKSPVGDGSPIPMDLKGEFLFLKQLEASGAPFVYQEGALNYIAQIDQIELDQPYGWNGDKTMLEGVLMVKLLTVN